MQRGQQEKGQCNANGFQIPLGKKRLQESPRSKREATHSGLWFMSTELLVGGPRRGRLQQKLLQANVGWYFKSLTNIDRLMPVTLASGWGGGVEKTLSSTGYQLSIMIDMPFGLFFFSFLEQSLLYYLWFSVSLAVVWIWILKGWFAKQQKQGTHLMRVERRQSLLPETLGGPWAAGWRLGRLGQRSQMVRAYCSLLADSPAVANKVKSKG